ncbi:MAG: serine hydrolase domain-containing protein [Bacteroidota bacterium]
MKPAQYPYYRNVLFALAMLMLAACDQKDPQPTNLKEIVDDVVFPYIAFGSNVGVVVGVINKGVKTTYTYGEKEIGKRDLVTTQMFFETASVTKTFTALALADMHLKGELNLDDPIENYLPATVKVPSRNGKKITLKQLANHTSGLPADPSNVDTEAFNKYKDYTEEKMYTFLSGYELPRDPGSEYQYSNVGYGLLGQIMSIKNKSSYFEVISSRILQPLGMANTNVQLTEAQKLNLAQGHNGNEKVEPWAPYQQNIFQGTGALYSTMDDMLIFLQANMDPKSTPLQKAAELTQQINNIPFGVLTWRANGIGMAWGEFVIAEQKILSKSGGNGGFTSFIGFNKATQTGVVILANSSMNPDAFPSQMGFEILKKIKALK